MKNKNGKILVFVFVGIIILLLTALWYQNYNTETFDMNSTIAADSNLDANVQTITTDPASLFNDPSMYIDPTLGKNTDINQRECAVYYVNHPNTQVDQSLRILCDQGFFDKPEVTMKVRENILRQKQQSGTITTEENQELKFIQWYNWYKPRLPNGACKVSFSGWVEPTKTSDNQDYPIKNSANFADVNRGDPKDWAFCYQAINSVGGDSINEQASRAAKKMADEKAILSSDVAVKPFNNNETYARIAFKTLTLDDFIKDATKMNNQPDGSDLNNIVCAAGNLQPASGLPADGSFIIVRLNETNNIQNFNFGLYNPTSQRVQLINDATTLSTIYKQLFTIQLRDTTVYIVPNRFNGTIYTLKNDICKSVNNKNTALEKSGRIVGVTSTKQFIFSLVANIGIQAKVLYQSLSPDDITYGDIPKLQQTLLNLQVQQTQTQQQIDSFVLPPSTPNQTGLQRKNYTINSFAWGMNAPDMDEIFSNTSRTKYTGTEVVALPQFYADQQYVRENFENGEYIEEYEGEGDVIENFRGRINLRRTFINLGNRIKNTGVNLGKQIQNTGVNLGNQIITDRFVDQAARFVHIPVPPPVRWKWINIHYGYIYEGYIQAPETGEYTIMINSDDGGDVMINNQMIATYYGGHWISFGGNNGKITMEAGKYYPIRIRMLQWEGASGIQLYWLKPSRNNINPAQCTAPQPLRNGLPRIPQSEACYEEIPASAYFYYFDADVLVKRAQYQNMINTRDTLIQQQKQVQTTIDTINKNFTDNANSIMQSLTNKRFSGVDFADVSNDGNFYIYIGSFNASLSSTAETITQDVVTLYAPTVNICTKNLVLDSPLNQSQIQSGTVQYSVAFWIRIDDIQNYWRSILFHGSQDNWGNNATIDRTPGIWVIPNSTGIHFSQRSQNNVNPWNNITENVPGATSWFHFAAAVNNNTIDFYINGAKIKTATLGANDKYIWNQQDKKLYINNTPPWGGKCSSSILLNNLMWFNHVITPDELNNLYGKKPFAKSIGELLSTAETSGTYSLFVNNNPINLYVYVDSTGKKWILVLLYNHRGGTNPDLKPIQSGNFPIPLNNTLDNIPIGRDESGTPAWGHIAPSYLANFSINEMAFWARGGTADKVINFRTNDPSVIRYATTGQGHFNPGFARTTGTIFSAQQSASIPDNAPNYFENQGDYALTNFPFWRGGQAHWGIRGLGNRWEIDDFPGNPNYNTLHMVFIC